MFWRVGTLQIHKERWWERLVLCRVTPQASARRLRHTNTRPPAAPRCPAHPAAPRSGARAQGVNASAVQQGPSGAPLTWFPWLDATNAFVTKLPADKDLLTTRRDTSKDPQRAPGLVNPQRYAAAQAFAQFPTLLGAPLASAAARGARRAALPLEEPLPCCLRCPPACSPPLS